MLWLNVPGAPTVPEQALLCQRRLVLCTAPLATYHTPWVSVYGLLPLWLHGPLKASRRLQPFSKAVTATPTSCKVYNTNEDGNCSLRLQICTAVL